MTAYIYDALRTPRGVGRAARDDKPGGGLSELNPAELVAQVSDTLLARNDGLATAVSSLTLGCVGQIGAQGGHIALVSRLASSLADHVIVKTLNNYCISGLTAVSSAAMSVQAGLGGLHLAGGVESLSAVGFLADKADYYSKPDMIQKLKWAPPVMGAELMATLEGFEKQELDALSLASHQKAHAAWEAGHYDKSVMAVKNSDGSIALARDELIRPHLTAEKLAAMPPAFAADGEKGFDAMMLAAYPELEAIEHLHSIGNCPGMADGAALVVVGDEPAGQAAGLVPMARIVAMQAAGGDPILQLCAGLQALEQLLARTGFSIDDFAVIEFMEAFAAPPLKFMKDFNPDPTKVNVNGGHIAMGHPMGATGAILLTTLVHELTRQGGGLGLVVGQAAGGIGEAMIIETV